MKTTVTLALATLSAALLTISAGCGKDSTPPSNPGDYAGHETPPGKGHDHPPGKEHAHEHDHSGEHAGHSHDGGAAGPHSHDHKH